MLLVLVLATITDVLTARPIVAGGDSTGTTTVIEGHPKTAPDTDTGLLPLTARLHDTLLLGGLTQALCDGWPSLSKNRTCLATLVAWEWVLVLIYGAALYFWERSAVAAAQRRAADSAGVVSAIGPLGSRRLVPRATAEFGRTLCR